MDVHNTDPRLVGDLSDLVELCNQTGACASTVICSSDKVAVYYKDPQTSVIQEADFVDELHIRHQKKARLLIAVFPIETPT